MILRLYKPHAALQHLINRILLVHYQLDPTKPRPTNPVPPNPEHCLYFYPYNKIIRNDYRNCSSEELPHSMIVGPKLYRVDLTMGYNTLVIIVCFHPGGLHRLIGMPMEEMFNNSANASLMLGSDIENVTEQINACADYDQMVQIVQGFLLSRTKKIKGQLPIDEVLVKILQREENVNVDQLAKQACVSVRQLERQFKERIGLPPKVFSRLVRFSRAWAMREKNAATSWLHIAHACNYADQMHMIRDFKEFTGVTPGVLQSDLEKSPLRLHARSE